MSTHFGPIGCGEGVTSVSLITGATVGAEIGATNFDLYILSMRPGCDLHGGTER